MAIIYHDIFSNKYRKQRYIRKVKGKKIAVLSLKIGLFSTQGSAE